MGWKSCLLSSIGGAGQEVNGHSVERDAWAVCVQLLLPSGQLFCLPLDQVSVGAGESQDVTPVGCPCVEGDIWPEWGRGITPAAFVWKDVAGILSPWFSSVAWQMAWFLSIVLADLYFPSRVVLIT